MKLIELQNIIDNEYTDKIVAYVNELDKYSKIREVFTKREDSKKIGRSQLTKLLDSCKNASSVEELKLYIKYQAAKANKGQSWNSIIDNNNITFVQYVLGKIDELIVIAENIYEKVNGEIELRIIKLKVVEKFLGYLYWKGTVIGNM